MDFRQAIGQHRQRLDTGIESNFSNFLYVDQYYHSNAVLRRIFSLARKHDYHSLLVEEIAEADCALMAAESAAIAKRRANFQRSEVHRLLFFRSNSDQAPTPADFIGYVVFKRDFLAGQPHPRVHVFESVMPPFRQAEQNNFIHCKRTYEVNTSIGKFSVTGVLYAQQNDLTAVCAHVALRTALACVLPEGDITYERMNALAGIDHTRQLGGGNGLGPQDMEKILQGVNIQFDKVVHEPNLQLLLPTEYQRDLYGCIESGFPALVGFELDAPAAGGNAGARHVIPVFGHTFNEDTLLPQAQRNYFGGTKSHYPSENWLSTFVVHDDNFGPYLCLPRHFLKQDNFRVMYGFKSCQTTYSAMDAEAFGFAFFNAIVNGRPRAGIEWYDRFAVFTKAGWLVLRTLLLKKDDYLNHLQEIRAWDGASLEPEIVQKFRDYLPPNFWMIEASAPELFNSSRRKFAEVLLPCDEPPPKPVNAAAFLGTRLPGIIYFRPPGVLQIEVRPTRLKGHVPLFSISKP